jgi:hypothetical protein
MSSRTSDRLSAISTDREDVFQDFLAIVGARECPARKTHIFLADTADIADKLSIETRRKHVRLQVTARDHSEETQNSALRALPANLQSEDAHY